MRLGIWDSVATNPTYKGIDGTLNVQFLKQWEMDTCVKLLFATSSSPQNNRIKIYKLGISFFLSNVYLVLLPFYNAKKLKFLFWANFRDKTSLQQEIKIKQLCKKQFCIVQFCKSFGQ